MSTTTLLVSILAILPLAVVPDAELGQYYYANVAEPFYDFLATYRVNFTRICPEKSAGINESVSSYIECLADTNTTLCEISDSSLENCTVPFLKPLEECVPEVSKQVPTLLVTSRFAAIRFLCENSAYASELLNSCFHPKRTLSFPCKQKYDAKLKTLLESAPNLYDVCDYIIQIRECLPKQAEQYCPKAVTKEAVDGLWEAMATPCRPV